MENNEKEKESKGEEQKDPIKNTNDGIQPKTESFINKVEELKLLNSDLDKKIVELRELRATELLGGTAGIRKDEEKKEETAQEYAKRILGY